MKWETPESQRMSNTSLWFPVGHQAILYRSIQLTYIYLLQSTSSTIISSAGSVPGQVLTVCEDDLKAIRVCYHLSYEKYENAWDGLRMIKIIYNMLYLYIYIYYIYYNILYIYIKMVWRNVMDTSGPTAWHRTYRNGTSKIKQACHRPHDHQAPFQRLESRMQVPRLNPVLVFQMQCSWTLLLRCILCTLRLWCHNTSQHVTRPLESCMEPPRKTKCSPFHNSFHGTSTRVYPMLPQKSPAMPCAPSRPVRACQPGWRGSQLPRL
jgi:hypothetical protein